MRLIFAAALSFAVAALAAPSPTLDERTLVGLEQHNPVPTYDPKLPITIFTDPTCKLSKTLTPGQPLMVAFPPAQMIGTILGPLLAELVTTKVINDIDKVGEDLCISANQDKADGNGLCNDILQSIRDLVDAKLPDKAHQYKCLLNIICVANETPANKGTCQYLLAGADCIANRLVGTNPECVKGGGDRALAAENDASE